MPIFADSTPPTSTSCSPPPEVPVSESVSKEVHTSSVHVNASDVGENLTINVTSEQGTSTDPPNDTDDIFFRDD